MFAGFFVRFEVDANDADVVACSNEAGLDFESALISADSLDELNFTDLDQNYKNFFKITKNSSNFSSSLTSTGLFPFA